MILEACEYSPLMLAIQLAALATHWPNGRLVEIWNKLPGVRKIAKFTENLRAVCACADRRVISVSKTAVARTDWINLNISGCCERFQFVLKPRLALSWGCGIERQPTHIKP